MKAETSLGFMINHAGRRITHLLNLRFQTFDMTVEQWTVLNCLAEQDGITQKSLANRVEKDQTNVTRILDQLERKELVARKVNVMDRRSFLPFITEKGRTLNDRLVPIERQVMKQITSGLAEKQRQIIWACLTDITIKANQGIQEAEGHH